MRNLMHRSVRRSVGAGVVPVALAACYSYTPLQTLEPVPQSRVSLVLSDQGRVGAGTGKYGFVVDAVEWRWRPDFQSPPPEGLNSGGAHWVEYPDCQRHYILWGDQLAVNWEKGGPNDGTWCGNPKYAPANSPSKDNYPRTN